MSALTLSYAKMIQSLTALTIWLSTYVKHYKCLNIIDTFQTMSNYKDLNVFMYVNVTNQ